MEINHSSKDDYNQYGAQAFQQFMEAAWMFMEDLSHSDMGEEDRKMIREQFLDGWKRAHSVSQVQVQAETVENAGKIQRTQRAEESSKKKRVTSHQEDEQKISKEQFVSFLCKAVNKGVVELKDTDASIQCLQEAMHGRSAGVTHKEYEISQDFDEGDEAVTDEGRVSGALERECSSKERENVLGPLDNSSLDNNQVVVSKAATAPRQREMCPSSGSQCMLPSSHVNFKKEGPHPVVLDPKENHVLLEGTKKLVPGMERKTATVLFEKEKEIFDKLAPRCTSGSSHAMQSQRPCSFAQVVKQGQNSFIADALNVDCTNISNSPSIISNEASSFLRVNPVVLEERLNACKYSIIGRLSLAKGEAPWTHMRIKEKLQEVWQIQSAWKCISLGKGYFHFVLNSQDEWEKVWSRGPILLKPGVMRLQRWTVDFDPLKQRSTNVQAWFRIFQLPWGFWEPSILSGIARTVGVPLRFDKVTLEGEFGHYARVLVDVDLAKPLRNKVHLECGNHMLEVKIVPESLPSFCRGCSSIGHNVNECKIINKKVGTSRVDNGSGTFKEDERNATSSGPSLSNLKFGMTNRKIGIQGSEWRRKNTHAIDKVNEGKEDSANQGPKTLNLKEPTTDVRTQREIQVTKDNHTNAILVSNKFSALDEMEDIGTCDSTKRSNNKNDRELIKDNEVEEQCTEEPPRKSHQDMDKLKNIREWADKIKDDKDFGNLVEIFNKKVDDQKSCTPKPSNRWSDMIDEEDENQFVPLNFQTNGEDMEIDMKTYKISPTSKRKNKKPLV